LESQVAGRASRDKGARAEREIVHLIHDELGVECRRGMQSRSGDDEADVIGLPGWHFEVKRCEQLAINKWLAQAESDAHDDEVPVVLFRRSNQPWRAIVPFTIFLSLLKNKVN